MVFGTIVAESFGMMTNCLLASVVLSSLCVTLLVSCGDVSRPSQALGMHVLRDPVFIRSPLNVGPLEEALAIQPVSLVSGQCWMG